ncbi:hypothetical protein AXF42_Ash013787 [Apostasia shenzhenica]|uniref:Methyltransferase-related protein n=1 Tax=Apostasia shenzhenica TaxID=1088818 RepID=A0A2I0A4V4_9ASPA|nr:hypothetical protein AXF42_Ash013787 [Apostasia shenzhenica]
MCPLRVILIFLSATIAGFFVLRGLRAQQDDPAAGNVDGQGGDPAIDKETVPLDAKARSAICSGFWTCVDMASGRYLWRHLVSPAADSGKKL